MERHVACEVQLNSELITNPYLRSDVIYALTLVLLAAAGHPVQAVLTARDRIVVQVPRDAVEEAAMAICPEIVEERLLAFFDSRV